jgi:hypothetical protein
MHAKTNLTYKNIREFTPEDTIYLQKNSGGRSATTLCQFVRFERNKVFALSLEGEKVELSAPLDKCALYGKNADENREHYHWFDPIGHAAYENGEVRHMAVPQNHPSYAMVSICRHSSSGQSALFGSSILHSHTLSLKIHPAELIRDLHEDRYHPRSTPLIEIEMSPQQFTDMLTSPNTMGTPATLRHYGDEHIEPCPFVSKLEQFDSELETKIRKLHAETKQKMEGLSTLIQGSKLTKTEKEHMTRALGSITQEIEHNLPFLKQQLAEEMDRVIGEAKASISSYMHEKARQLSLPVPEQPISIE